VLNANEITKRVSIVDHEMDIWVYPGRLFIYVFECMTIALMTMEISRVCWEHIKNDVLVMMVRIVLLVVVCCWWIPIWNIRFNINGSTTIFCFGILLSQMCLFVIYAKIRTTPGATAERG
jgi:hypothetical protein